MIGVITMNKLYTVAMLAIMSVVSIHKVRSMERRRVSDNIETVEVQNKTGFDLQLGLAHAAGTLEDLGEVKANTAKIKRIKPDRGASLLLWIHRGGQNVDTTYVLGQDKSVILELTYDPAENELVIAKNPAQAMTQ